MDNINARLVFSNAIASIKKAFKDVPNFDIRKFKLTQSFIRLELALVSGQSSYRFNLLSNQTAQFNTEQRLNLQDSFVPDSVGFFQALPTSSTDITFKPLTYANPFLFTNPLSHQSLYNGQLSIMINNNNIIPNWDLWRHWVSPQTQQTAAAGAGSPIDELHGNNDGFWPMEPNVVLIGSKNYQINVSLPAPTGTMDTNSRMILYFRGILAQNSTVVS